MELSKKDIEDLNKQGYTKKQIDDASKEVDVEEEKNPLRYTGHKFPETYQPLPKPEPSFRINVHVFIHDHIPKFR